MKLIHNTGTDRVIDLIRLHLKHGSQFGCVTPAFSLFAFAELRDVLSGLEKVQLVLPPDDGTLEFLGGDADRTARNRLQVRWLAMQCAQWINDKVELHRALGPVPQGAAVMRNGQAHPEQVVLYRWLGLNSWCYVLLYVGINSFCCHNFLPPFYWNTLLIHCPNSRGHHN